MMRGGFQMLIKGRLTQSNNCPFVGEIVTVHHQDYYQGKLDEALDIESPIPNQQIAMIGSFILAFRG